MQSKIYFAKSNRANPNDIILIRKRLSEFDVEIVEYSGGSFSHKPMLDCDMLVILPELTGIVGQAFEIPLGKGLHEQIDIWNGHQQNKCDLLIVSYVDNECDEINISEFDSLDFANEDDYVNYSVGMLNDIVGTLKSILSNRLDFKPSSDSNENSEYAYLLIGK